MTASDPRVGEIQARYQDCLTYNFGMRNADKLAHEDVPYLLAELAKRDLILAGIIETLDGIAFTRSADRIRAAVAAANGGKS